ncbi:ankyrin repeat-containing protein BDA1-like [Eucalyptus grandis]|uniref:ankyrin repeat-containing protein BDA1-like n=1 Tax=Eucalyptus grandis TaxID=71139 RepID=UPI00192F0935|nr:ankyrin repeat-containing protein BDA1-like [Eucalyptus grandis]
MDMQYAPVCPSLFNVSPEEALPLSGNFPHKTAMMPAKRCKLHCAHYMFSRAYIHIFTPKMERRLLEAAQKGNIDELNDLIKSNGLILEEMAIKGAGNIPLHVACGAGHFDFVRELLKLMPRFTEKVNVDGFSLLHIAAAQGDVEIARELLSVDQCLFFVKGRERRIPLHYAVVNGELHVMKLLLFASPESVMERIAGEETVLHLAVKNNRFDGVVALVEHLKQNEKEQVINWKDHRGNTVLHLDAIIKNF